MKDMYTYFIEMHLYGAMPNYSDMFYDYATARNAFNKTKDVVDYFGGHVWLYRIDDNLVVKVIDCY